MAETLASSDAAQEGAFERHLVAAGEHLRRDEIDRACDELRAALEISAREPRALALLGLAHFRRADFEAALPIYRELVAAAPENASYRLNLGLVHLKVGDAETAIDELSLSRELDPSQPRTVSYLGLAYARLGAYDRAYQAFLLAGENALAAEMASHLSPQTREDIQNAVNDKRYGAAPTAPRDARADEEPSSGEGGVDAEPEAEEAAAEERQAAFPSEVEARGEPGAAEGEPSAEAENRDERAAAEAEHEDDPDAALEAAAELFAPAEEAGEGDAEAVPEPVDGAGAITRAVDMALPSAVASAAASRAAVGHKPPQPVSELATERLIRPEDGHHTFEIGAGGMLIVRVDERVMSRTEGVIVSGGDLAYEPATRHARGSATDEVFGGDDRPMFIVSGHGQLVATPLGEKFAAVSLDDDILYLREDLVYAFEPSLQWENGYVPGSESTIPVVQFRGQGSVAMRSRHPLISIKLMAERVLYVDADVLAGWVGRVIPRIVAPAAGGEGSTAFVECTGEGVVLLDDPESAGDP